VRWSSVVAVVALLTLTGVIAGDTHASRDDEAARQAQARAETSATLQQGLSVEGLITVADVTVTASANGTTQASGTLYAGASTTPMSVDITYQNENNWTIIVQRNSAGSAYQPPAGNGLDINDVSGTITRSKGAKSYEFVLEGQTIGDAELDMTVTVDQTGLVASAIVQDMTIGGMVLESASVAVSTADATADITATLTTEAGTFDAELDVIGPGPLRGKRSPICSNKYLKTDPRCTASPTYRVDLTVDGADLAGSSGSFTVTSFGFSVTVDTMTYGCTYVDTAFRGSAKVGNNTYTLKNGELAFCGNNVSKFVFAFEVSHYEPWSKVTKTADLTVAWTDIPGTYTTPAQDRVSYDNGFFGSVNLFATRTFSKKYSGRTFNRGVTVGIAFGVAVYQPTKGAQYTSVIGGGGYFDADRVSGAIGCKFQVSPGTDMNCGGELRLNPSWAGVYHDRWDDL